ncbi:MAG: elongation factor P [Bryobacteraceae bacterium]
MILSSQLRPGMIVRFEGQTYRVLSAEYHPGQGKMGGAAHTRLQNLKTGTQWEHSFRAELKIEDLAVDRVSLEFLYADGGICFFMNPDNYEQVEIPAAVLGDSAAFLQPQMKLPVEFVDGEAVHVVFPDFVEIKIADTPPPVHQQQDSTWKLAKLDNGLEVMVPQFIKTGDAIRLDVATLKYMDRVRASGR